MEETMDIVISLAIQSVLLAVFFWLGMKITKVDGTFPAMIIIAVVSLLIRYLIAIVLPLGFMGTIITGIITCVLISKWTDAEFYPDAVLMVVVSHGLLYITAALLLGIGS